MISYVSALICQIDEYSVQLDGYTIDTVFIGGGTPTVLPQAQLVRLINHIFEKLPVSAVCEFTIESNPASADSEKLSAIRKAGVNRLSIGMQSVCGNELTALGRCHSYPQFRSFYDDARRAGYGNINIDVMLGIPEQTLESVEKTVREVTALAPEHVSAYGLKIEQGTPFWNIKDSLALPDEETERSIYFQTVRMLDSSGYKQYEISNFAKDKYECIHNLKYWQCGEYIGFGSAAHSYFRNVRFSFQKNISLYIKSMLSPGESSDMLYDDYIIQKTQDVSEDYIMLHFRLTEGIDKYEYNKLFNEDFDSLYLPKLKKFIGGGLVSVTGKGYRLTLDGMYISNYILSELLFP